MDCLCGALNSIVPKLWDSGAKRIKYLKDLEDNLASLRSESLKLKNRSADVRTKHTELEGQQKRVQNQIVVNGWLERAGTMEKEVDEILLKGEQELGNKCLASCCPKNCRSSYKIGKNVLKMIPRVTKLIEEGQFDVVADGSPPPSVDEQLRDNLVSLSSAMVKLKNLRDDVMNRVTEAEEQHMKRTNQVNWWLTSVEAVEKDREELECRREGISSPGSNNKLLEEVMKMVSQVTTLAEEGQFVVVAHQLPPPAVDELPMDNVVGFESKFEDVWQSVHNNEFPVIGLVGMGGVGKTTLLKQLNNKFLNATHEYDLVIWIVVSKPANLGNIRAALRSKLNIPDHVWENKGEDRKNSLIFNKLKKKKFILFLDDMWEGLELSKVGVPRPSMDSMSKIVFTTRSGEVCRSMEADKVIQVGCLPADEAFSLFYSKLEGDILKSHPKMRGLIADVASECEGLPLALITIARAMRGKTDARQWKEAKRTLEKYPSTFEGMEAGVFSKLVFSFDSLPNQTVQKCFEYCSLYPEDHNIPEEEAIKLWLAEGFVGEYDSMYDALIQGRQIMESLRGACLLETVEREENEEKAVKMHDVVRDMALWIACERGEKKNKFCVASGDQGGISVAPNAEKISLWGRGITTESLAGMSSCPHLATLIVQKTAVKGLSGEIVYSANALKVLDLSNNLDLTRLPTEDGYSTHLEYLNIVSTGLEILPVEVSQCKKLRFLIVGSWLHIPRGIISSLCSLQMFEQQVGWSIRPPDYIRSERESMERDMLHELEALKHIMDIRLTLYSTTGIEVLLNSPILQKCTTRLVVDGGESLPKTLDLGTGILTKHLERLRVTYFQMSEIKLGWPSLHNNLCEVYFSQCHEIRNLSSLIYVPNLSVLYVQGCSSMSELIGEETRSSNVGTSLFSSLTSLTLTNAEKLRSICPQSALPFPSLESMTVSKCWSLRKLPFDSDTVSAVPQQFIIRGNGEWWDELEWDTQATKDAFTPKFITKNYL